MIPHIKIEFENMVLFCSTSDMLKACQNSISCPSNHCKQGMDLTFCLSTFQKKDSFIKGQKRLNPNNYCFGNLLSLHDKNGGPISKSLAH